MLRFVILVSVGVLFTASSVSAGFKWLPPVQNKNVPQNVMEPVPVRPFVSTPPMPVAPPPAITGFPAAPVMASPLESDYNNYSISPPPSPVTEGRPVLSPVPAAIPPMPVVGQQGVYINPYPLRDGGKASMTLQDQSVSQAMMEQAGAVTPVQLGAGMTTGVSPKRMKVAARAVPRAPQMDSALTPIPGGDSASLDRIEEAYRNPNLTNGNFPKTYAHAVGFGRDLPLELALSQVIPSEFSHRVIAKIDPNLMVSWEGGEPWNVVLNQMLHPHNMTAIIQENQVIIQSMAKL